MLVRYMILSPSEEARQAFLGGLFGTFELSPRGQGEKVNLDVNGGELEVIGTGRRGKLRHIALKLLERGVQLDGILILIPSGDEDSWQEAKAITRWIQSEERTVPVKTWVFAGLDDMDKESIRNNLLILVSEHEHQLAGP